jgi:hypothetical protein
MQSQERSYRESTYSWMPKVLGRNHSKRFGGVGNSDLQYFQPYRGRNKNYILLRVL